MLKEGSFEVRDYQKAIAESALQKNTLVVLPTGMGKTLIAVLVGINRLQKYPDSKILITAPTRPLNAQHKKSFEKFTKIDPEEIVLITGQLMPNVREELYKKAKIIVATPQTIRNDLDNGILNLENFSFATFDEAHRSIKDYAYTTVARKYIEQSKYPLILGLTASPGGSKEKIEEIRKNLFIQSVEIRSEVDKDVKEYVKEIQKETIYVDFPEEFQKIKNLLEAVLKDDLIWLRDRHFIQTMRPTKKLLLTLQSRVAARYSQGSKNFALIWAMIRSAEAIKIEHGLELLETQVISSLLEYLKKMESSKKRSDKRLFKDPRIREVIKITGELAAKNIEHPKLAKILEIISGMLKGKDAVKIIVFANYRFTVEKINQLLRENGIKSQILIGQATKERKGLTQKEQIEILKRFGEGEFNVLVGTSISEEGLDVPAVDYAIFYEAVPSEIRSIQRRGRVGRQVSGKIVFLMTKDTRDEGYYYASMQKEKKMKRILYHMRDRLKAKKTLKDWL